MFPDKIWSMDGKFALPDNLPKSVELWDKIRFDLQRGVKLKGTHPGYTDVIKVWTTSEAEKEEHPHQFLLIATAKHGLALPVGSLELFAYSKTPNSWKLSLIQHPFPQPRWEPEWKKLINGYHEGEPNVDLQTVIIESYLKSQVDEGINLKSFNSLVESHSQERVSWVRE